MNKTVNYDDIQKRLGTKHQALRLDRLPQEFRTMLEREFLKAGLSKSTTYTRLYDKGFDEWELKGVEQCLRDFCEEHKKALYDYVDNDDPNWEPHYAYILALNTDLRNDKFIMLMKDMKLVNVLREFMSKRGMGPTTAHKRFHNPDFKEWEMCGALSIIKDVVEEYNKTVQE